MLYPELEEKLHHARHALTRATSENVIELCKRYLALLAEYRSELYKLKGASAIDRRLASSTSQEAVDASRKLVRGAIEKTTRERNRTQMLLLSLTTVSGYEAVEIFNRRKYEGHDDWVLRASGLKSAGSSGDDVMTIPEAVAIAGLLRREKHLAQNAAETLKEGQA